VEFPKELAEALDKLTNGMAALVERLDAREEAEAKAVEEAERKEKEAEESKAPTAAEIAGALREAALSPKAEARVLKQVEKGEDLAECIKVEKEIAADVLAEAGKTGFGNVDEGKQLSESDFTEKVTSRVFG
jgi:ribosomal protein L16 Arg81 hydroxylase